MMAVVVNPPSGSGKNREHGNKRKQCGMREQAGPNDMPIDQIAETGL